MASEVAKKNNTVSKLTIKEFISAPAVIKKMNEMLESPKKVSQFTTSVIAISSSDELLASAEPRSVFNACLTAASLNLPINKNLGYAHIIGYKNNKKGGIVEAQFQIGAKGFKQLAQRTGQYKFINDSDVREGELKTRDRLSGEMVFEWIEDDAIRNKRKIIGYVSYFELNNGFTSTLYMSKEEVDAHAKQYSQAYKSGYGPWKDNYDAMARKTVTKLNLSKNGPVSTELETAIVADQAVIKDEGKYDYIDGEVVQELPDDFEERMSQASTGEEIQSLLDELTTPDLKKKAQPLAEARFAEL
ncbi:MAG TPA: recombinase RecT [Candidatus Saccharibacteria bacterium]|nr:recombinase RecT [Candidatus Saccharibacteria bacterium]